MKLAERNDSVIKDGLGQETAFTIKATSKAFKILSDGLYSDKITAVIRELSCNAYDAHIANGNPETPFLVHLPNTLDPEFRIRDYGTGMSEQNVMHLYTTYFESTKTDSNDFIGALGLGSKSPFSYTDSFVVVSYFNGQMDTYTAYLDNGLPNIAKISSEETTEPNGIEIKLAVVERNYHEFAQKAAQVYRFFKVKPTITGTTIIIPELDFVISGDGYGILKSERYHRGEIVAIQGNIGYPLTTSDLNIDPYNSKYSKLHNISVYLFFDIGQLDIAASREKLSFDDATIKTILAKLEYMMVDLNKQVQDKVKDSKTFFEAKNTFNKLNNMGLFSSNSVQWNGKQLSTPIRLDISNHDKIELRGYHPNSYSNKRPTHYFATKDKKLELAMPEYSSYYGDSNQDIALWVDDVGPGVFLRLAQHSIRADVIVRHTEHVVKRKVTDVQEGIKADKKLKKILASLEGYPIRYVSELDYTPIKRSKPRLSKEFKLDVSQLFTIHKYTNPSGRNMTPKYSSGMVSTLKAAWQIETLPKLGKDKLFLVIDQFIPNIPDKVKTKAGSEYLDKPFSYSTDHFLEVYSTLFNLNLITDKTEVYGIKNAEYLSRKDEFDDQFEFFNYAMKLIMDKMVTNNVLEQHQKKQELQQFQSNFNSSAIKIINEIKHDDFAKFNKRYAEITNFSFASFDHTLYTIAEKLGMILNSPKKKNNDIDLLDMYTDLIKRYPLILELVTDRYNRPRPELIPMVNDYVIALAKHKHF